VRRGRPTIAARTDEEGRGGERGRQKRAMREEVEDGAGKEGERVTMAVLRVGRHALREREEAEVATAEGTLRSDEAITAPNRASQNVRETTGALPSAEVRGAARRTKDEWRARSVACDVRSVFEERARDLMGARVRVGGETTSEGEGKKI